MENIYNKYLNTIKKLGIFLLKFIAVCTIIALAFSAFYNAIDFVFKGLLSYTARAVLANFIVFAGVFAFIFSKKVVLKDILEKAQTEIKNKIQNSQKVKEDSEQNLLLAQERIKNLDVEIDEIIENFKNTAQQAGVKIIKDVDKATVSIQEDTKKIIENNKILLKNEIVRRTSNALIEIAKDKILFELDKNPQLHDKLIEESIQAVVLNKQLEGV